MSRSDVVKWRSLTARDRQAWRSFRDADPGLRSPYFDLGWFDAVDRARGDLHVLRVLKGAEPVGFFAFHPGLMGSVRPAGGTFCDWHGFVAAPDAEFDTAQVIAGVIATLRFQGAPVGDRALSRFAEATDASNVMAFPGGFESYARPPGRSAPKSMALFRKAMRKLEGDGREVEFRLRDTGRGTLDALIALKSEQYRRTRYGDLFAWDWSRRLLERLIEARSEEFEAPLSSLWIDGKLAAAHLGLRSRAVVHYWMPAYDPGAGDYAPGHVLTLEMARAFAGEGVAEMDLGAGAVRWKREFANAGAPLIRGVAHAASPAGRFNAAMFAAGRRWGELPLGPVARLPHKLSWRLDRRLGRFARPPGAGPAVRTSGGYPLAA